MYKAYAKECPAEYVEDPFEYDDFYKPIYTFGNRDFAEHIPEELARPLTVLRSGELADILEDIERGAETWYKNAAEAITDFIDVPHKPARKPATRTISRIKKAVIYYAEGLLTLAEALTELTGVRYEETTIRGCCQSDWENAIFPADNFPNGLKRFEADYFGLYQEYEVHEGDAAPAGPDDITGYFVRVYDDPAEEIAAEAGCKPDEVKIFRFGGYKKIAVWEG